MLLKALAWNRPRVSPAHIQLGKMNDAAKFNLLGMGEPRLFTMNHVKVDRGELGTDHFIYHTRSLSTV